MDPLCHTLVGAALGCTGLQKKTRYSRVTLIVAANLPDIDVVAHFMGDTASYAYRRGITHGIPALIVLPFLLAAIVYGWSRLRGNAATAAETSFRWLLILSVIGVLSHPALDWLNTYGMRWLMPMVDRWFYGDTLFIIDWVAWLILLAGIVATRLVRTDSLRWFARPASVALGLLLTYIGMNYAITQQALAAAHTAAADNPPVRALASPLPFNPLRREVLLEYPDEYHFGSWELLRANRYQPDGLAIDKGDPAVLETARQTVDGQRFLHWARFPYSLTRTVNGRQILTIADARYIRDVDNPRVDGFAILELAMQDAEQAP